MISDITIANFRRLRSGIFPVLKATCLVKRVKYCFIVIIVMFRVIGQEKVRQRQRFFCLSQKKVLLWSMKIQCSPRKKLKQCFSAQWGCVDLAFMFLRFIYTYDLSVPFADHDNLRTSPAPVNSDAPV